MKISPCFPFVTPNLNKRNAWLILTVFKRQVHRADTLISNSLFAMFIFAKSTKYGCVQVKKKKKIKSCRVPVFWWERAQLKGGRVSGSSNQHWELIHTRWLLQRLSLWCDCLSPTRELQLRPKYLETDGTSRLRKTCRVSTIFQTKPGCRLGHALNCRLQIFFWFFKFFFKVVSGDDRFIK